MEQDTLSSGQVAKLLNISSRTIRRYLIQGRIAAQQNPVTGRWRVSRDALWSFMKRYNLISALDRDSKEGTPR